MPDLANYRVHGGQACKFLAGAELPHLVYQQGPTLGLPVSDVSSEEPIFSLCLIAHCRYGDLLDPEHQVQTHQVRALRALIG